MGGQSDCRPMGAMVSELSRTPARRVLDDKVVAWRLAAAAHSNLSTSEADQIYIAIGIGDEFDAIDALLTAIVRDRIPLEHDLVMTVDSWLDRYRGQNAEPRLRQLLADIKLSSLRRVTAFERRLGSP